MVFSISADIAGLKGQLGQVVTNFDQTFSKVKSITNGLNIRQLEETFKTSLKNTSDAGIESFALIAQAGASFYAAQDAQKAKRTILSSLTAANIAAGSGPKGEAAETARFEKIRADALNASRNAFKEFEATVRSGGKNISGSLAANAASATALGSSLSGVIGIAKSLGLVLGPLAIIGFAKGAFTAVGALKDLSDVTGISSDMLLKLKPVLENAGSSAEAFASSINIMQAKIVEGSAETVTTLGKLGISMDEALALADDPEGLLDKFAKGLAGIADQATRVEVARALGGRGGARALLALADSRGLQPIRDQKAIISKEEIDAIDRAGDLLNTLKIKLEAVAAAKILPLVNGFIELHDIIVKIGDPIAGISDAIQKALEKTFPWVALLLKAGEAVGVIGKNAKELQTATNSTTFRDFPAATQGGKVDLSQATFSLPGAAAVAPGRVESDQQKLFNKSIEETIDGLRAQTRALTESGDAATDHAAKLLEAKAVTLGFAKGSAELTAKLNEFRAETLKLKQATFADTLIKQNQAIEVQIATMTQGAEAGQRLALQHAINNARLSEMGKAARGAADAQGLLNKKLLEAVIPQARKALTDDTEEARQRLQIEGPTFNIAAATRDAKQKFIEAMRAVRGSPELKALAFEAILKVTPELDRDKLLAIKVDLGNALGAAEEKGATLNKVFSNTFDVGAAKVDKMREALNALTDESTRLTLKVEQQELALSKAKGLQPQSQPSTQNLIDASPFGADVKASMAAAFEAISSSSKIAGADIASMTAQLEESRKALDKVNASAQKLSTATDAGTIRDAFKAIDRDIAIAENQAILFGNAFDLAGAKVQAVQSALQGLTVKGITASNPAAQQIAGQLSAQKLSATLSDLRKEMALSAAEAQVLGGAINLPAETIGSLTNAIKILVKEFGPLHPELQQLKKELEDARAAADIADGFKSIAGAAVDAINDLSNGSSLKDALKNLAAKISSAITDALVTKPLQRMIDEWINSLQISKGGIFGGIFGGGTKLPPTFPEGSKIPLPEGVGQRPPGVEGPSLPNGGWTVKQPGVPVPGAIPGSEGATAAIQAATTAATTAIEATQTTATTAIQALATEGTTAIQAASTEVTTAIQTLSTEATTAIQVSSTEATTALQAISIEGQTVIQAIATTSEVGINITGATAQAGIEAVKEAAIAAIQAQQAGGGAPAGGGGVPGGIGGSGLLGGLFGESSPTGISTESLGAAFDAFDAIGHRGGAIADLLPRYHLGGQLEPNERTITAEVGEFMFSKEAVRAIGVGKLQAANDKREWPPEDSSASGSGGTVGAMGFANRSVDTRAFAYAPRYHQGIDYAGGEMPAILKRGEEVGWPKDLAEKYGRGGKTVNVNMTVFAKDAGSFHGSTRSIIGKLRNGLQNSD